MPTRKDHENKSPLSPMSQDELTAMRQAQLSRRTFLRRSGGIAGVAIGTGTGSALVMDAATTQQDEATTLPFEYEFNGVPDNPEEPPSREFQSLSDEQAGVVEALTARMLPGTPDDPGAREAGVVHYIDFLLASNSGFHEPVYAYGPYARTYEGDTPPEPDDGDTVWVQASEIRRYGYQAPISPLQVYQLGIEAVQHHAQQNFGGPVTELDGEQQDQIITDLLNNEAAGFDQFAPVVLFHTLRRHTAEGMFGDPSYGGNRDMVGWTLVGFPGAQRAYSPEAMQREDEPRPPQALAGLSHFHPGVTGHDTDPNVIQPVRDGESEGEGG